MAIVSISLACSYGHHPRHAIATDPIAHLTCPSVGKSGPANDRRQGVEPDLRIDMIQRTIPVAYPNLQSSFRAFPPPLRPPRYVPPSVGQLESAIGLETTLHLELITFELTFAVRANRPHHFELTIEAVEMREVLPRPRMHALVEMNT